MIKQTININHKKYATGLFWQPVGIADTPFNHARQLVKNINKKYNLYIGYKSMVGLGSTREGHRVGMLSAAAEIVESLSEFISFLGVFEIDSRFYLIAVRNAIVIRDVLIEDEQEARKVYAELSDIPDWGALFAPSSWGMPRSQEKTLNEIIRNTTNAKLRPVNIVRSLLPSIFFIALFFIGGMYLLQSPIMEVFSKKPTAELNPELAAEYKRQIELKNQELDKQFDIVKEEPVPMVYPYDNLPNMIERADLCYRAIAFVMQPVVGWNQTYAKCDQNYVSANFVRDFGNLNQFYEIGANLMPGATVQQISDDEIIVRVKLPELKTAASVEERDATTVMRDVATNFQKININANIDVVSDTITNGMETDDVNVVEISASSKLMPAEFMQIFNEFEGVYITSIVWNANTKLWNYEIIIYTK